MTITAQKSSLTKQIKAIQAYLTDCENELKNQYPQPNGAIYLHGNIIAFKRQSGTIIKTVFMTRDESDLRKLVDLRKSLDA